MTRAPGSYAGLTARQADLLSYLRTEQAAGRSPSYREMGNALGLVSLGGVKRLVEGLQERGFLTRVVNGVRSIQVFAHPMLAKIEEADLSKVSITAMLLEIERRTSGMVKL